MTILTATLLLPLQLGAQDMALIPTETFKASLMRLAFSKSSENISARFNDAMAESPEWFKNYLQENKGVKPLPYHPNFGISKEEYETMLRNFDTKHLEKISEVTVKVAKLPDGSLKLDCPDLGKSFSGIILNRNTGNLNTPWLSIELAVKTSGASIDGNPFGDWQGISWKKVESDPEKGDFKSVSLIAGRLEGSGTRFMALRVKVMEANKIKTNFETLLQFDVALSQLRI